MYKCQICGQVKKGIKQIKVVTKIRTVKYLYRNAYLSRQIDSITGIPKFVSSAPKVVKETEGFETAESCNYCPKCAPKDNKPETVTKVTRYIDRTVYTREKRERSEIKRGY